MGRPRVYSEELRERADRLAREWRKARGVADSSRRTRDGQPVPPQRLEPGDARGVPRRDRRDRATKANWSLQGRQLMLIGVGRPAAG